MSRIVGQLCQLMPRCSAQEAVDVVQKLVQKLIQMPPGSGTECIQWYPIQSSCSGYPMH